MGACLWTMAAMAADPAGADEPNAGSPKVPDPSFVTPAAPVATGEQPTAEAPRAAQLQCPITGKARAEVAAPQYMQLEGFFFWVADAEVGRSVATMPPAEIFAALAKNGDAAEPLATNCPVTGKPVDKNRFLTKDGRRVYVCDTDCFAQVERDWVDALRKLYAMARISARQ